MKYIDPQTGQKYEVADGADDPRKFGFVPLDEYEAQQRASGVLPTLKNFALEPWRQVASGAAATVRGIEHVAQAIVPPTAGLDPLEDGQAPTALDAMGKLEGSDILPEAFSKENLELRAQSPISTALGATVPLIAGGVVAGGGLAATAGMDLLSGAAQEATDADIEDRDISGEHILRNGGLNLLFSGGAHAISAGARAVFRGAENAGSLLEQAASGLRKARTTKAAASEAAELSEAAADPLVREDLLQSMSGKTERAVAAADRALAQTPGPRVANAPNAQREAVEVLQEQFAKSDALAARAFEDLRTASGADRLFGLRELRSTAEDGGQLAESLDSVLSRADLWGDSALTHAVDIESAMALRPGRDATPEALRAYTDAVRRVRGGELGGYADDIEHLVERAQQIRLAPELGGVGPAPTVAKPADYAAALDMSPAEAWRFKQGGGIEGTRKVAAHSAADAFDKINNGLRQDAAMAIKRENFVAGSKNWEPALIKKQAAFAEQVFDKGADLLKFATESRGPAAVSGYDAGGFAQQLRSVLQPSLDRMAGLGTTLQDAVTRNYELDLLKRGLDGVIEKAGASKTLNEASKAEIVARTKSLADVLRGKLADVGTFGQNGSLQADINAGWTKLIKPWSRIKSRMSEMLGREFGATGVSSAEMRRFDAQDIQQLMAGEYDRNLRRDLTASLAGIDELMRGLQTRGITHLEGLSANRAALQRIDELFRLNDVLRVADATAKEPVGEAIARRALGALAGGASGHIAGGPVVGAAGAALGRDLAASAVGSRALLEPGGSSSFSKLMRSEFGQLNKEQAQLLGDRAFSLAELSPSLRKQLTAATGAESGVRTVQLAAAAKEAAEVEQKTTARVMVSPQAADRFKRFAGDSLSSIQHFQGDHETLDQAFVMHRAQLEKFAQNPMLLIESVSEEFGDVENASPALHRQMVAQAFKINTFLQSKVPGRKSVSVARPNGTPPGSVEVRTFAVYFMAATQPSTVMADARAGRLRQEQVEALRELWPREYLGLRTSVLEEIGSGKSTPQTRQRMNLLFNFGESLDPAFGPKIRAMIDDARQQRSKSTHTTAAMQSRSRLPSQANQLPGGMANLQLGPALDQGVTR